MHEIVPVSDESRPRRVEPLGRPSVGLFMGFKSEAGEPSSGIASTAPADFVRGIIDARLKRRRYFGDELFADPAWDILLELYALRCEQRRTSVSKLSLGAAVPTTTALRWIEKLDQEGLVDREPDPCDARRIWVELSDRGFRAMESYLRAIGGAALA